MGRRPNNPFTQNFITFKESDHSYTDKNGEKYISVSQLLSKYSEKFDPTGVILAACAKRDGISKEELKAKWDKKRDDSCEYGTSVHAELEYFLINKDVRESPHQDIIKQFEKIKFNGTPFSEVLVFSEQYKIAGQSDIIIYNKKENSIGTHDLKTNEKMVGKVYKNLLYPLNHLPDSKLQKYELQISLYSYLLEQKGFEVRRDDLCLYWVNPARKVEIFPLNYKKQDIENLIEHYCADAF